MVGDEIALGSELFVVAAEPKKRGANSQNAEESETGGLSGKELVSVKCDDSELSHRLRPRTVREFSLLHDVAFDLSTCDSVAELMARIGRWLNDILNPQSLWIARAFNGDDLVFYPTFSSGQDPSERAPLQTIRAALREHRGIMLAEESLRAGHSGRLFTMVMPVSVGGINIAAIAVKMTPREGYDAEYELEFLALLAKSLAPFIHAIENIERLEKDTAYFRARANESPILVGASDAMLRVQEAIAKAAGSELNVLFIGETGTGKELAARTLYAQSRRSSGPFIVVNCAAVPGDLLESQLFGHKKGAFTGAVNSHIGLLTQAHGGTLFLDEVGDMSLECQARILRAIESGTFRGVGAKKETYVDMRVVAATNADLHEKIKRGEFREDLFYRLNGFEIHIPPLRDRPADIPVLAHHFFELARSQARHVLKGIAPEALEHLQSRAWPGNVRELRNTILRAVAVAGDDVIGLRDLLLRPEPLAADEPDGPLQSLREAEKSHISAVLKLCDGDVRKAAQVLHVGVSTLYKKLSKFNIGA